ncbi:hypothetical protein, partial [Staphylococcus haemolyticus]|uniref:hypothetical protein n=1 Tax=Staphylococcus haemolyticus TaxID=1283 RepID=UPI0015D83242
SLSKDEIMAIVTASNEIMEADQRKQQEINMKALQDNTPDVQSASRPNTATQQTRIDADGTINLGSLTTKGTVFLDDKPEETESRTYSLGDGVTVERL